MGEKVKKEWLLEKISVKQAEEMYMVKNEELGPEPVPFGFMNGFWRYFKSIIQEGDELWTFSNSRKEWMQLAGRKGVCIVRDGEIIHSMLTKMS